MRFETKSPYPMDREDVANKLASLVNVNCSHGASRLNKNSDSDWSIDAANNVWVSFSDDSRTVTVQFRDTPYPWADEFFAYAEKRIGLRRQ